MIILVFIKFHVLRLSLYFLGEHVGMPDKVTGSKRKVSVLSFLIIEILGQLFQQNAEILCSLLLTNEFYLYLS